MLTLHMCHVSNFCWLTTSEARLSLDDFETYKREHSGTDGYKSTLGHTEFRSQIMYGRMGVLSRISYTRTVHNNHSLVYSLKCD